MGRTIRTALILLLGAAIGAGGYHLYSRFKAGAEIAVSGPVRDLSDDEIRDGILSEDLKIRLEAVAQMDKLDDSRAKAALLGALAARYPATRLTAVTALAKRFPTEPEVVGGLLEVAGKDPDTDVRQAAIAALQRSGDPRALDLALEVLNSTDSGIALKLGAAETLDRLTGRTTASGLSGLCEQAEGAADDLLMEWEDWLGANRGKLTWDAAAGKFVGGE